MAWYWIAILIIVALFGGYVIKDRTSPEIVIKGKIWQWGRNSNLTANTDLKVEKKPRKRRNKRNKKKL